MYKKNQPLKKNHREGVLLYMNHNFMVTPASYINEISKKLGGCNAGDANWCTYYTEERWSKSFNYKVEAMEIKFTKEWEIQFTGILEQTKIPQKQPNKLYAALVIKNSVYQQRRWRI